MKRFRLRLSVVATLLVLGLIAIAHAQRGDKTNSALDDLSPAANSATPQQLNGPLRTAGAADEPQRLPSDSHVNPLRTAPSRFRSEGIRTTAAEDSPADAGTFPRRRDALRATADMANAPSRFPSLSPTPIDPFSSRSRTTANTTDVAASDAAGMVPGVSQNPATNSRLSPNSTILPIRPQAPASSTRKLTPEATGAIGSSLRGPAPLSPAPLSPAPSQVPSLLAPTDSSVGRVPPGPSLDQHTTSQSPAYGQFDNRNDSSRAAEGTGKPGGKHLDGPQAPQVTIQKIAPPEAQVGKPATFQIKLKNTGPVAAFNVEIRDVIPKGARLTATTPKASAGVGGELLWKLGTLKPNDEITVEVQIVPLDEGPIGSVASVSFSADASAQTISTKPQLVVKTSAPPNVLIGDNVTLTVTVSNPGSGVAHKVVLEERVPPGLQTAGGPELENEIGDLKPNETRQLELKLTAIQPGPFTNVLIARGDVNLKVEDRLNIEVLAPRLEMNIEGPKRRFLEREAAYTLSVSNPGTAPARQVELVTQLPTGLKFVRANNNGHYDETTRSVRWRLEELPIKDTGTVELVTLPVEVGEQTVRLRGTAERGLSAEKDHPVIIDGISAIMFEVADTQDPVEVNGETTYEIRVVNQGSKAATNVQITAELPQDMRPVAAEGPTRQTTEGRKVVFEPLARLAAKADTTYRVRVQGLKSGDQRVRVQLLTDEIRTPITKEESTRVFSDE